MKCDFFDIALQTFNLTVLIAFWMVIASAASVTICFFTEFGTIVISYVTLISIGCCSSLIAAYSTTLYPVNCRAIATSFISLSSRLGAVFGGNLVSLLLNVECRSIFYVYAVTLISEFDFTWKGFIYCVNVREMFPEMNCHK